MSSDLDKPLTDFQKKLKRRFPMMEVADGHVFIPYKWDKEIHYGDSKSRKRIKKPKSQGKKGQ